MTTQPQRADWWVEVTDPNEVHPDCPVRIEQQVVGEPRAVEFNSHKESFWKSNPAIFVDSRWAPPEPSVKVGATVTTKEQLDALPNLSVILSMDGQAWQLDIFDGIRTWYATFLERGFPSGSTASRFGPFTVVWLPEGAGR